MWKIELVYYWNNKKNLFFRFSALAVEPVVATTKMGRPRAVKGGGRLRNTDILIQ